jgi:hypothetical protein
MRPYRLLTLVLAAIQLAMPAVTSVADGAVAKLVSDPGMHVESLGDNQCTPPHSADCAVCRYLSGDSAPVPEPVAPMEPGEALPPFAVAPQLRGAVIHDFTKSRAPPAV